MCRRRLQLKHMPMCALSSQLAFSQLLSIMLDVYVMQDGFVIMRKVTNHQMKNLPKVLFFSEFAKFNVFQFFAL